MARTESTMLALGVTAPAFSLPEPLSGQTRSLEELRGERGTLVVFICNHCPYVLHILDRFVALASDYQAQGVRVVAISSNDADSYREDGPQRMAEMARAKGFSFPYLYDESQQVAKAYQAACTPDFYLFDAELKLVYRGQFDGARPRNEVAVTGEDLSAAVAALAAGQPLADAQRPSMGCNIKWKAGNEPDYFG